MSAALIVVEGVASSRPGAGTIVDVRVDRAAEPLGDLARLLDAADVFAGFHRAVEELMAGDPATALRTIDTALALLPGEPNLEFVRTGALGASGHIEAAAAELRALVADHPTWEVIVRSFASKGLMTLPPGVSIDDLLDGP